MSGSPSGGWRYSLDPYELSYGYFARTSKDGQLTCGDIRIFMRDGTLAAVVFDFDGLIVDTETPGFISWQEVYQEFGAALNIDDWRHATGYVGGFDPAVHLERLLGRRLDWSQIIPKREARNWELTIQASTLPGIEALLRSSKERRLRVGVASNSGSGWVEEGLQRLGLRAYVDAVVTRDMVINPKPAPDIYLKTVQTLIVEPRLAVALEDSEPGA